MSKAKVEDDQDKLEGLDFETFFMLHLIFNFSSVFLVACKSVLLSFHQFWNPTDQSRLRTAWFRAIIGPQDSEIGKKRATLFYMQPEKYFM